MQKEIEVDDKQTIFVTSCSKTTGNYCVGGSHNQLFINFTSKMIPTIPTSKRTKEYIISYFKQIHSLLPI